MQERVEANNSIASKKSLMGVSSPFGGNIINPMLKDHKLQVCSLINSFILKSMMLVF